MTTTINRPRILAPKTTARDRSMGVGWLAFPTWAYAVFFFVIPMALVVWYSFGYKPDEFTTYATDRLSLGRYVEATAPIYRPTFLNTLTISTIGTALALLISMPFAYWLAIKSPPRWRMLFVVLLIIPFSTNFIVRTTGLQITLGAEGWLSRAIQWLGGPALDILYTRPAVQIGVVYNYLPLMILPLFVAMDRAGQALREASRDLGANRWSRFFRVTLPLAAPGIASGCLLMFIPLTGDYATPEVLGGAQGSMAGQMIARQFGSAQNWALGSAMAVTMMIIVFGCVAAVGAIATGASRLVQTRIYNVPLPTSRVDTALPDLPRLTPKRSLLSSNVMDRAFKAWSVVVYLCLFTPILVIVVYSFNTGPLLEKFTGFGLDAYKSAIANDTIVSAVGTSLEVAVISALIAAFLGALAGISLGTRKRSRWWGIGLTAILVVTLVTPDIADAIGFLPWFVTLGVDWHIVPLSSGLVRLVIAHAAVSMAVVAFVVRARVKGMDPALEEAAADLYTKRLGRLRHVTLPAALPGIAAGGLLAFTFSLDDVVIATFVQQVGHTPFPVYVLSSMRMGLRPEIAAMSTVIMLLTLLAIVVASLVFARAGESTKSVVEMISS